MRGPTLSILILAALVPTTALAGTTNHLLQPDPGPYGTFVAVCRAADGEGDPNPCLRFGGGGGRVDLAAGVVRGRGADGTAIAVPLADVTTVRVRFERGGRAQEYDLLVDALRGEPDWPPHGRIRRAVLTSGVTIDFSDIAPGLDPAARVLFWSCEGEAATRIPYDDLVLVQIRSNSFVRDFNDMAVHAVLSAADLASGEVVDLAGRHATIDAADGTIRYGAGSIPLGDVRRLEVRDCRRPASEVVPLALVDPDATVASPPAVRDEVPGSGDPDLHGERVRWSLAESPWRWLEGCVIAADSVALRIVADADTLTVPLADIGQLRVARGTGDNATTGALVGGALVGMAGLVIGQSMMGDGFLEVSGGEVAAMTAVGVGIGAAIGAVIGSASSGENWEDVERTRVGVITTPGRAPGLAVSVRF